MIVHDHRFTSIAAASALALGMLLSAPNAARASEDPQVAPVTTVAEPAAPAPALANVDVSLSCDGRSTIVSTKPETVGEFLTARGIHVAEDDFVSQPLGSTLVDGMNLAYRSSKLITILDGAHKRVVRSNAATIAGVLREAGMQLGAHDRVAPASAEQPLPNDVVRIDRSNTWTVRHRSAIAQSVRTRTSENLAAGRTRTIDPGVPGIRETTTRIVRIGNGHVVRTLLASRIIRAPRARLIERGVATYTTLASAAARGFSSALHFAGSAIHMIATAYTASCYGCSGITATGVPAGFGVIAVDPNVIPLGTKLFIPGYGRAVAGDTGGAIVGHRVDLGMNTVAQALHFGRRPITVYVLR